MIRLQAILMQLRRFATPVFCALALTIACAENAATVAKSPPATAAVSTNTSASNDRQLIEQMLERRLQKDTFKGWQSGRDSLEGMAQMSQREMNLTPAQQRRLKDMLDEQRLWMFASTDDKSDKNPFDKASQNNDNDANDQDASTPHILKKFFNRERDADGQSSTNKTKTDAETERDLNDPLLPKPPGGLPGKSSANSRIAISHSAFERSDAPSDNAIGRLFQKGNAGEPLASAPRGMFGTIFAAVSTPGIADNSIADKKRMDSFRQLLSTPAPAPMISTLPSGGAFGGSPNYNLPRTPSSPLASPAGGSSLFGNSSLPAAVPASVPNVMDYQPMGIPKRKF